MWTGSKVREVLPVVRVQVGRRVYKGRVTGRSLPLASVLVRGRVHNLPWITVVDSLNSRRPVQVV